MQPSFSRFTRFAWATVLGLSLAACGGGDGSDNAPSEGGNAPVPPVTPVPPVAPVPPVTPQPPAEPDGQGALKAAIALGTIALADISAAVAEKDSRVQNLQPRYAVTSYRLEYLTVGADGQSVRASGLVSVPVKAAGARSPVLSYQHGTIFKDAETPSNNAVASEVAVPAGIPDRWRRRPVGARLGPGQRAGQGGRRPQPGAVVPARHHLQRR